MKPQNAGSSWGDFQPISRRTFLRQSVGGALAASAGLAGGGLGLPALAEDKTPLAPDSETLATTLYKTLTERQRKAVCFSFDDPLRLRVENNWRITKPGIGALFDKDQQAMIQEIFLKMHSEEYAQTVLGQVIHDQGKAGFGACAIAFFGEPGTGKFQLVFTGRHVTRRCDGDSVAGAAFGGPIFYGHAARSFYEKPDHPDNVYWYQAKRANEVFDMMDGKQRKLALLGDSRGEHGTDTVKLSGKKDLPGIPMSGLTKDQQEHVRKVLGDVLAPFRKVDFDEAMKLIDTNGFDHLHMSFYKNEDVGNDKVWDVWQIEGPAMVWYFRGDPHIHTWVHIRESAA